MTELIHRDNKTIQITFRVSKEENEMKRELCDRGYNISHIFREALKSSYCDCVNIDKNWERD